MAKTTQFQFRMDSDLKVKAHGVAEREGQHLSELLTDLLEDFCNAFNACEACEEWFRLSELEGKPGNYICRDCLEQEAGDESE